MMVSRSKKGETKEKEFELNCKYNHLFAIKQNIPSRMIYRPGGMQLIPLKKAPYDFVVIDEHTGLACIIEVKTTSINKLYCKSVMSDSQQEFFKEMKNSKILVCLVVKIQNKWMIKTCEETIQLIEQKQSIKYEDCSNFYNLANRLRDIMKLYYSGGSNVRR